MVAVCPLVPANTAPFTNQEYVEVGSPEAVYTSPFVSAQRALSPEIVGKEGVGFTVILIIDVSASQPLASVSLKPNRTLMNQNLLKHYPICGLV